MHIAKSLLPIYCISGDDVFLKQEAVQCIRKAATAQQFSERIRLTLDTDDDMALQNQLYAVSLLAEKRLIEFDFRDTTPSKAFTTLLQRYAEQPSAQQVLLLTCAKLDTATTKSKWYQAIEKQHAVIPVWPISVEQLPDWIIQRARKYKLTLDRPTAVFLSHYVEGNSTAAAQAIEKLYLLQRPTITTDHIEAVLAMQNQYSVFDFCDALFTGKTARALQILQSLQDNQTEPTLILWAITRELRLLAEMSAQLKQGTSFTNLAQHYKLFAKRATVIKQALQRYTQSEYWQLLQHALQLDTLIKGFHPGSVWDALQLFCLRLETKHAH